MARLNERWTVQRGHGLPDITVWGGRPFGSEVPAIEPRTIAGDAVAVITRLLRIRWIPGLGVNTVFVDAFNRTWHVGSIGEVGRRRFVDVSLSYINAVGLIQQPSGFNPQANWAMAYPDTNPEDGTQIRTVPSAVKVCILVRFGRGTEGFYFRWHADPLITARNVYPTGSFGPFAMARFTFSGQSVDFDSLNEPPLVIRDVESDSFWQIGGAGRTIDDDTARDTLPVGTGFGTDWIRRIGAGPDWPSPAEPRGELAREIEILSADDAARVRSRG